MLFDPFSQNVSRIITWLLTRFLKVCRGTIGRRLNGFENSLRTNSSHMIPMQITLATSIIADLVTMVTIAAEAARCVDTALLAVGRKIQDEGRGWQGEA